MKPSRRRAAVVIIAVLAGGVVALRFAPACLLRINLDPGAVRLPYFAVMNPMRDRTPEQPADRYFRELGAGRVAAVSSFFGAKREVMLEEETKYPPVSWKVTDRRDESNRVQITYRVNRGGGYEWAEEATFEFLRKPACTLSSYNAVY